MTLKEFREKVVESKYTDWLKERKVVLRYKHLKEEITKQGITEIFRFFKTQKDQWQGKPDDLPNNLKEIKKHFNDCVSRLDRFIEQIEGFDENRIKREWDNFHNVLSQAKASTYHILTADSAEVDFLLSIYKDFRSSYTAAYEYLINDQVGKLSSSHDLRGIVLAYEFDLQDHPELLQRRNNEKKSIGQIRSNFEEQLGEAENATAEYISRTKDNFDEHTSEVDQLIEKKEAEYLSWYDKTKKNFEGFDTEARNKAKELEELYTEKLRLAAPVEYWRNRATDMRADGKKWAIWFGSSVMLAATSLFILLWLVPDDMTAALFNGEPAAIKWTLLFITFISFLAYGVRTFAKLTFSSYHLARDAEEREQLTHVYLALKKDGNVEEIDRQIILQSLFSRAETGLLKDDSSPTMPSTFLEKLSGIK